MGFSILKEFPSRFVSGEEIVGHVVEVTVKDVKKELAYSPTTRKKEPVIVIYFEGKERGVRLGKERAVELKTILGSDDTDAWKGKRVNMCTEKKEAFGKMHNVIHFKEAQKKASEDKDLNDELNLLSQ